MRSSVDMATLTSLSDTDQSAKMRQRQPRFHHQPRFRHTVCDATRFPASTTTVAQENLSVSPKWYRTDSDVESFISPPDINGTRLIIFRNGRLRLRNVCLFLLFKMSIHCLISVVSPSVILIIFGACHCFNLAFAP